MQMILLYALLSLLFLLFSALKSKFLETSKKEYVFSFLGTTDRGLLSSWKAFLLLQLAYWVRAVENLGGGLVLICRTRERRSGWVKLVRLHECLPSVGERCLPSLWPGHLVFDLCFPCDEPLTRSTVWTLSHRSYLLAKVRAMKHSRWILSKIFHTPSSSTRKRQGNWRSFGSWVNISPKSHQMCSQSDSSGDLAHSLSFPFAFIIIYLFI